MKKKKPLPSFPIETVEEAFLPEVIGCGMVLLRIRDFSAGGKNVGREWYRKYSATPFWVQITDEDDLCLEKTFATYEEAKELFDDIVTHPEPNKYVYKIL